MRLDDWYNQTQLKEKPISKTEGNKLTAKGLTEQ